VSGFSADLSLGIANGLSVISIAISVWVGINIYNVIERSEFDELKRYIYEASRETMHEREEERRWRESTKIQYQNIENALKKINKEQFVNQINKLPSDPSSVYFSNLFADKDNLDVERYLDLMAIEICLQRSYRKHRESEVHKSEELEITKKGLNKIKAYYEQYKGHISDYEDFYLKYRKGDFEFWKGSCLERNEKYRAFQKASEIFIDIANQLNFLEVVRGDNDDISNIKKCGDNDKMSAYFANAIGECYSSMYVALGTMTAEDDAYRDVIKESALKCMGIVDQILDSPNGKTKIAREIYYRNSGCALERGTPNITTLKQAGIKFKEALALDATQQKAYYTSISNKNKLLQKYLEIQMRKPGCRREKSLLEKDYQQLPNAHQAEKELREFQALLDIALKLFPYIPEYYAFSVYRKIYEMCLNGRGIDINMMEEMRDDLEHMRILSASSNLCQVARDEIEDLYSELNSGNNL
jgi:hypothetical protein